MHGWMPIFFLFVVLKIPVGMLLYIVWWASRSQPATEEAPDDGGSARYGRHHPSPRPRGPRRGPGTPGAAIPVPCPPGGRIRIATRAATLRARR